MDSKKLETVRSIARRNHGLVTRRQLKLAKLSKDEITDWTSAGLLARLCPSIFRSDEIQETWDLQALVALTWAGDGAALCLDTAAGIHGMKGYGRDGPIHVTLPTRPQVPKQCSFEMILHSHHELGFWDATLCHGMRVTRVERTLLDLAGELSDERVEDLIDDALTRELTRPAYLHACYKRLKRIGRKGCGPFGRILRRRGRLDLAYPNERVAVEADSREYHSKEADLIADQIRQNDLVSWGWSVLRFRTFQLKEPSTVARIIRETLAGRAEHFRPG